MDLSSPDERAKAVGAANTLWLDGDTLRATNTDVEGFLDNLDAATPGWDRGLGKRDGARRRRRGARRGVRADPARRAAHLCRSTARPSVPRHCASNSARAFMSPVGRDHRAARRLRSAGQHHGARHGRPAAARDQSALSGFAGGRRSGLCAAEDRAVGGGARARPAHRRRARHVAASGGARFRVVVRRQAGGDAGTAGAGRSRPAAG